MLDMHAECDWEPEFCFSQSHGHRSALRCPAVLGAGKLGSCPFLPASYEFVAGFRLIHRVPSQECCGRGRSPPRALATVLVPVHFTGNPSVLGGLLGTSFLALMAHGGKPSPFPPAQCSEEREQREQEARPAPAEPRGHAAVGSLWKCRWAAPQPGPRAGRR